MKHISDIRCRKRWELYCDFYDFFTRWIGFDKMKALLHLRYVKKCIVLTKRNYIRPVKFAGDMEYKFNSVTHLWRKEKEGRGDALSVISLFWIIFQWLKSNSLCILFNSAITSSVYINMQKIYLHTFLECVQKLTQRKHIISMSLFLTVQQPRQLRLTLPGSLKNVCLAPAWTRNYHLTGDKFHFQSPVSYSFYTKIVEHLLRLVTYHHVESFCVLTSWKCPFHIIFRISTIIYK